MTDLAPLPPMPEPVRIGLVSVSDRASSGGVKGLNLRGHGDLGDKVAT